MNQRFPRIPHCAYGLGLLVVLALVAVALTPPGGANEHDIVEVRLVDQQDDNQTTDFAFEPSEITIEAGTTVRWVWTHDVFHTVSSGNPSDDDARDLFDQGSGSEGDTLEFTFDEPGEFPYFCSPHSGFMRGTVIVEGEESTPGVPVPILLVALVGLLLVARRGRGL